MNCLKLNGRPAKIPIHKYMIKWDKPACSKFQTSIQNFFYPFWRSHVVGVEVYMPGTLYRFDLVNFTSKIIIESSWDQHTKFNKFFHKTRNNFFKQIKRDLLKEQWAELNGFTLIHIYNDELKDLSYDWVLEKFGIEL